MENYVIIVAGGIGLRMNSEIPKQFMLLKQKPILIRTIERFIEFDSNINIIITLPEKQIDTWKTLCREYEFNYAHKVVCGGITRFHSVQNALAAIDTKCKTVAVHDGVRPLVSIETIQQCFDTAEKKGNAIPVIEISESLRRIQNSGSEIVNRNEMFLIQTPQVFSYDVLSKAYKQAYTTDITDDASVVERDGNSLNFVKGNRENIKITLPEDITFAEKLM